MEKKAELLVVHRDNGISFSLSYPEEKEVAIDKVALNESEAQSIGEAIWNDIFDIYDKEDAKCVLVKLEFKKIDI